MLCYFHPVNFNLENINKFVPLSRINSKYIPYIAIGIAAIIISLGFIFIQGSKSPNQGAAQKQTQDEIKKLVAEVGKLIELPQGETPTIATVTDISKLKDQPFFAKAKNGDKVLIYANARKAILYDPQAKKIVDIAPINIGSQSAQTTSPSPSPTPKPTPTPTPKPTSTSTPSATP